MFSRINLTENQNHNTIFVYSCDAFHFETIKQILNTYNFLEEIKYVEDLVTLCKITDINSKSVLIMDLNGCNLPLECYQFIFNKFNNVVLVSDCSEHAVWAFDYGAIDFILFPFNSDRLQSALNKIKIPNTTYKGATSNGTIIIKHGRDMVKLNLNEIIYIKAMGNYIRIYMENNKCITSLEKISFIQHRLPAEFFLRIHKSYIINSKYLNSYNNKEVVLNNDITLPLSLTYKHHFRGNSNFTQIKINH